ncbi:MAG: hypothetical protein JXL80_09150 [Planctomycetes bacterium]|nr:hypothetical protein [Planctomycetota bacterium]
MTDFDFWKKQYQGTWDQSSEREKAIGRFLSQATDHRIVEVGLGAGASEFISGAATQHGHMKGDADLRVEGTDIYLEVTGPLVSSVDERQDLWIRPDKILNAREKAGEHETWIVHHLPKNDLIRVVPLDDAFWAAHDQGEFPIVTPRIRGVQERYRAIPAGSPYVKECSVLIARLKKVRPK